MESEHHLELKVEGLEEEVEEEVVGVMEYMGELAEVVVASLTHSFHSMKRLAHNLNLKREKDG